MLRSAATNRRGHSAVTALRAKGRGRRPPGFGNYPSGAILETRELSCLKPSLIRMPPAVYGLGDAKGAALCSRPARNPNEKRLHVGDPIAKLSVCVLGYSHPLSRPFCRTLTRP